MSNTPAMRINTSGSKSVPAPLSSPVESFPLFCTPSEKGWVGSIISAVEGAYYGRPAPAVVTDKPSMREAKRRGALGFF